MVGKGIILGIPDGIDMPDIGLDPGMGIPNPIFIGITPGDG
jgi:hypothetical protein